MRQLFAGVFGKDELPAQADFFELGGDSLRAITLALQIAEVFGVEVDAWDVLEAGTSDRLAGIVDARLTEARAGRPRDEPRGK